MIMKKVKQILQVLLPSILIVATISCNKDEAKAGGNNLVVNNYNVNISSSTKEMDTVSADLDNDGVRDVRLITSNNQYTISFQPAKVKMISVERLHNNIEFAYTLQYSNSYGFRLYNFGGTSLFIFYAKAFSAGASIDSLVAFTPTQYYCTSNYVFSTVPGFSYNETVGDFANTTTYAAFRMTKSDGKHYGWIRISNSNNCMNASLVSSGYSKTPGEAVTTQ